MGNIPTQGDGNFFPPAVQSNQLRRTITVQAHTGMMAKKKTPNQEVLGSVLFPCFFDPQGSGYLPAEVYLYTVAVPAESLARFGPPGVPMTPPIPPGSISGLEPDPFRPAPGRGPGPSVFRAGAALRK